MLACPHIYVCIFIEGEKKKSENVMNNALNNNFLLN